ncbi:hypothetical protein EJ06DRAFT_420162 [Trichodelitschia bisporula]|uniref:Uncharacterized protein n=1 Tax=Trichodelitschia bisporula TaxID=703511 RepID=A0A6G1HWH0_9PEZI|nr:hypothetical protein EJ06DRAFT_420162 [Trichodelitschia bisporula]
MHLRHFSLASCCQRCLGRLDVVRTVASQPPVPNALSYRAPSTPFHYLPSPQLHIPSPSPPSIKQHVRPRPRCRFHPYLHLPQPISHTAKSAPHPQTSTERPQRVCPVQPAGFLAAARRQASNCAHSQTPPRSARATPCTLPIIDLSSPLIRPRPVPSPSLARP